jgi:hypothetical protein
MIAVDAIDWLPVDAVFRATRQGFSVAFIEIFRMGETKTCRVKVVVRKNLIGITPQSSRVDIRDVGHPESTSF